MTPRLRRLRRTAALRETVAETRLHPAQLIQPHFVIEGDGEQPVDSMPGISRMGIKPLVDRVAKDFELGITNVLLFGVTDHKDAKASSATDEKGVVPRAIKALRDKLGEKLVIMTDVCLCGSMDHGHCGVVKGSEILNDESLPLLSAMALAHAKAGAFTASPRLQEICSLAGTLATAPYSLVTTT